MIRLLVLAMLAMPVAEAYASEGSGGRLSAIASGRIYDRISTPTLNPSFNLQPLAEKQLLRDLRDGRVDTSEIPPRQLRRLQMKLQQGG